MRCHFFATFGSLDLFFLIRSIFHYYLSAYLPTSLFPPIFSPLFCVNSLVCLASFAIHHRHKVTSSLPDTRQNIDIKRCKNVLLCSAKTVFHHKMRFFGTYLFIHLFIHFETYHYNEFLDGIGLYDTHNIKTNWHIKSE